MSADDLVVTSADRVVFPPDQNPAGGTFDEITKGDVVAYYGHVAPVMIRHLESRPLTLHRFPRGIDKPGFFQKNTPGHYPASIVRVEIPKSDGTTVYPVVNDPDDIPWLANQGVIVFHIWTSRQPELDRPDRIVFDLDPSPDDTTGVLEAAQIVCDALDDIGIPTTPMATGSKGYHLITQIQPAADTGSIGTAAHGLAELLALRHPDLLTTEFHKKNRKGRVFVDWLRNRPGQTSVAPWSLRSLPGAPVAVPFRWDELEDTPPRRWTLRTIDEALDRGDPLVDAHPVDFVPYLDAIAEIVAGAGITLAGFDRFRP